MNHTHLQQEILQLPDAMQFTTTLMENIKAEAEKRHAFLELIHEECNAEFINGNIVMHSPVRGIHWRVCTKLSAFLTIHVIKKDLGVVGSEKVMIQLTRNNYEPDICFFSKDKAADFTDDQLLFPAPDFIVEILSKSTQDNDYGIKFNDYAAHGVAEYWIIDAAQHTIEQYKLQNGEYILQQKVVETGTLTAFAIEGFEINIESLFD